MQTETNWRKRKAASLTIDTPESSSPMALMQYSMNPVDNGWMKQDQRSMHIFSPGPDISIDNMHSIPSTPIPKNAAFDVPTVMGTPLGVNASPWTPGSSTIDIFEDMAPPPSAPSTPQVSLLLNEFGPPQVSTLSNHPVTHSMGPMGINDNGTMALTQRAVYDRPLPRRRGRASRINGLSTPPGVVLKSPQYGYGFSTFSPPTQSLSIASLTSPPPFVSDPPQRTYSAPMSGSYSRPSQSSHTQPAIVMTDTEMLNEVKKVIGIAPRDASRSLKLVVQTPNVAQKSYGTEKRFICPPPMATLIGFDGSTAKSRRSEDSAIDVGDRTTGIRMDFTNSPLISLTVCEPGNEEGRVMSQVPRSSHSHATSTFPLLSSYPFNSGTPAPHERGEAINISTPHSPLYITPAGSLSHETWSLKHIWISDSEKRKSFQIAIKLFVHGQHMIGSFLSKQTRVISKPSKKRCQSGGGQVGFQAAVCVKVGGLVALFNRIRSQTVSTKYLAIGKKGKEGSNVVSKDGYHIFENQEHHQVVDFLPSSSTWTALRVRTLDSTDENVANGRHEEHDSEAQRLIVNQQWNGVQEGDQVRKIRRMTTADEQEDSSSVVLRYNQRLVLECPDTGLTSCPLIVRKIDKGTTAVIPSRIDDRTNGDPVSQLHKVAFQLDDGHPGFRFLALMGESIGIYQVQPNNIKTLQMPPSKDSRRSAAPNVSGNEDQLYMVNVTEASVWTIIGASKTEYNVQIPNQVACQYSAQGLVDIGAGHQYGLGGMDMMFPPSPGTSPSTVPSALYMGNMGNMNAVQDIPRICGTPPRSPRSLTRNYPSVTPVPKISSFSPISASSQERIVIRLQGSNLTHWPSLSFYLADFKCEVEFATEELGTVYLPTTQSLFNHFFASAHDLTLHQAYDSFLRNPSFTRTQSGYISSISLQLPITLIRQDGICYSGERITLGFRTLVPEGRTEVRVEQAL